MSENAENLPETAGDGTGLPLHVTPIGRDELLLEPGEALDPGAADHYLDFILDRIQRADARCLYYDLQSLPLIDPVYYAWLTRLAKACHVIGVRMVAVHMRPTAAFGLSSFLQGNPPFETALDVNLGR